MQNIRALKQIIESVEKSLEHKIYFSSLATIFILLDLCSKIESPKEKSSRERYIKWIQKHLEAVIQSDNYYLTAENIYYLRCSMLHEGSTNPTTQNNYLKYADKKVNDIVTGVFEDTGKKIFAVDQGEEYPTLFIDIEYFCVKVNQGVRNWMETYKEKINNAEVYPFSIAVSIPGTEENKLLILRSQPGPNK